MSGPDMILGFIISYADGKLQEYMKPDLESKHPVNTVLI